MTAQANEDGHVTLTWEQGYRRREFPLPGPDESVRVKCHACGQAIFGRFMEGHLAGHAQEIVDMQLEWQTGRPHGFGLDLTDAIAKASS